MADQEYQMSASEKKKEDWMNSKWRPMMGWMYMGVCIFDFMLAPILWSIVQSIGHGQVNVQWQPLTLQGAGLFHVAMGAVLGLAAYGRTQEKLNGATMSTTTVTPPSAPAAPARIPPRARRRDNRCSSPARPRRRSLSRRFRAASRARQGHLPRPRAGRSRLRSLCIVTVAWSPATISFWW